MTKRHHNKNARILRSYIRNSILEAYDFRKDLEALERHEEIWKYRSHAPVSLNPEDNQDSIDTRRTIGAQFPEEIEEDKNRLKDYQQKLRTTEGGKQLIKNFQAGNYTVFHSISWVSYATSMGFKEAEDIDPVDWVKKFNKKTNRNQLSTFVAEVKPGEDLPEEFMDEDISSMVESEYGVLLKGYPVYVSQNDVMSQTHGGVSQRLMDMQKGSGIAKRPSSSAKPIVAPGFVASEETILDNWQIIGIWTNAWDMEYFDFDFWGGQAKQIGVPLYVYRGAECIKYDPMEDSK